MKLSLIDGRLAWLLNVVIMVEKMYYLALRDRG